MQLTAPVFLFLFLPLSLLVCRLLPLRRRRLFLSLFSIFWFALSNRNNLIGLLHVELLMIFALLFAYLPIPHSPAGGKARTIVGVVVPTLSLCAARLLSECGVAWYTYPIGLGFITLNMISFVVDLARGDTICPENPLELMGYLLFFPSLTAGPVIRSKFYFDNTEKLTPGLSDMSNGIRLYMRGFIERMALAAVLLRAMQDLKLHANTFTSPLLLAAMLLVSFCLFYFFIVGNADMARGVCALYGIPTRRDRNQLLSSPSPDRLFYGITLSLHNFFIDYIYRPIRHVLHGKFGCLVAKLAVYVATILFFRLRPELLLFGLPVLLFAALGVFTKRRYLPLPSRFLLLVLSMLFCSLYTLALSFETPIRLLDMLPAAFEQNVKYEFRHLFETVQDARYLFPALLACTPLFSASHFDRILLHKASPKLYLASRVCTMLLYIAGFVFTLFFFYPQFPT